MMSDTVTILWLAVNVANTSLDVRKSDGWLSIRGGCAMFGWWRRAKPAPVVSACEDMNHEIRNAVLGVHLERRRLWKAIETYDMRTAAHLKRIESALKDYKEPEND